MTERELQERLRRLCRDIAAIRPDHILYYHTYDSRRSPVGFPDAVIIAGPPEHRQVVWVELKADSGKLSPEQAAWMEALRQAGQTSLVVRPRTWEGFRDWLLGYCGLDT